MPVLPARCEAPASGQLVSWYYSHSSNVYQGVGYLIQPAKRVSTANECKLNDNPARRRSRKHSEETSVMCLAISRIWLEHRHAILGWLPLNQFLFRLFLLAIDGTERSPHRRNATSVQWTTVLAATGEALARRDRCVTKCADTECLGLMALHRVKAIASSHNSDPDNWLFLWDYTVYKWG